MQHTIAAALVFFSLAYLIMKYQVMYVNIKEWESGGKLWPKTVNRILAGCFIWQVG